MADRHHLDIRWQKRRAPQRDQQLIDFLLKIPKLGYEVYVSWYNFLHQNSDPFPLITHMCCCCMPLHSKGSRNTEAGQQN